MKLCVTFKVALISTGLALAGCSQASRPSNNDRLWLSQARFGVFVHYLVGLNYDFSKESFDVEKFADQIVRTHADYVIFTVGQNSGYFCCPNAAYDRYTGYAPGERCSRRDLPMAVADALAKHNIRFILYSSARSPEGDPKAMEGLADKDQRMIPQEHVKRWSEVIKEWSLRYGKKISGWWFDGVYRQECWNDYSKPYNFKTWAAACRAGNPNSLLAFNNGADIEKAFILLTDEQDYTAGEQGRFGAIPEYHPAYPGKTWHILSYLGYWWAEASGPNYTDDWLIDYVKRVNRQGGVVSIDVNVSDDGTIYPPHFRQLTALGDALSK